MNTLPHIRCYECGKVIGQYDKTIQRLTSKSLDLREAVIASGYENLLPLLKELANRGYNYVAAMIHAGVDVSKVYSYMFSGPTLKEVFKALDYDQSYVDKVEQLMKQGLTIEESLTHLGLNTQTVMFALKNGLTIGKAMDILGINRYCCRMHVMNPIVIPLGAGVKEEEVQAVQQIQEINNSVSVEAPVQALASSISNLNISNASIKKTNIIKLSANRNRLKL
jgi:DNA-directed RNA polymerase subunit N (RpoN/RPB10)